MLERPIVRNLVVFTVATPVYAVLYAQNALWEVAGRWFGPLAMLGWVAMVPALFGFTLQRSIGRKLGTPVQAVVAAPVAAHAVLLAWEQLQPFAPSIRERAVLLVLIIGQVLFVHIGALLGNVRRSRVSPPPEPLTRASRRREDRPRKPPHQTENSNRR